MPRSLSEERSDETKGAPVNRNSPFVSLRSLRDRTQMGPRWVMGP